MKGTAFTISSQVENTQRGVDNNHIKKTMGKERGKSSRMLYFINESPPWYLSIFLGFQHYLMMIHTVSIPLIVAPLMCITSDLIKAELIGSIFFVSGIITLLQVTIGSRLPIVQGGCFAFLAPTIAILRLPQFKCPSVESILDLNGTESTSNGTESTLALNLSDEIWKSRMNEIQGAIIGASLFEILIGATGTVSVLLRFIGPISIAPTISLIGISAFVPAANYCSQNWPIAIMTIVLIILFSQYFRNIKIPCCAYDSKSKSIKRRGYPAFRLLPVFLAFVLSWLICYILTVTNAIPNEKGHWGVGARTDTRINVLYDTPWFRIPYPGQYGYPKFSVAGVFGMLAGVIAGMVESVGDYYACARISGAPPPPVHTVNRGILIEGIGCVLAGLWGTTSGTTSYSQNIGAIAITKVASRHMILCLSILLLFLGAFPKFGAVFVSVPYPIIGGILMVTFGMISAVGISNLQFVDLNSSRNLCIFGFSLFFGLSMPHWLSQNQDYIKTGSDTADQILTVLLGTSMFVGGLIAFILDNTVPGTYEERGLLKWRASMTTSDISDNSMHVYNLPLCNDALKRISFTRFIPICPEFKACGEMDKEREECDSSYQLATEEDIEKDHYRTVTYF